MQLQGWWYHATNEADAIAKSTGMKKFGSDAGMGNPIYFSRSPKGGAKNLYDWDANPWVIAVTISANSPKGECEIVEGMRTDEADILAVRDVRCICVLEGYCKHREESQGVEAAVTNPIEAGEENPQDEPQEGENMLGGPQVILNPIEPGAGKRIRSNNSRYQ